MDHLPVRLDGFSSVEASTRFKFFAREVRSDELNRTEPNVSRPAAVLAIMKQLGYVPSSPLLI